jgi:CheY-like chemotaxis protein
MGSNINSYFDKAILGIAQAYGQYQFWLENLFPGSNPDATWRALMVISALKDKAFVEQVSELLKSSDSRVRGWACYYFGSIMHQESSDKLLSLTNDPSPRVRQHARHALSILQPGIDSGMARGRRFVHDEFKVLISEDNPQSRQQLSLLLERAGFVAHYASTEEETLILAEKLNPQIIITDNQKERDNLSGLNMTWDLCRNSKLREIILIMLTVDEIEPIFLWQGGDYFLNKLRFGAAQLVSALTTYMT